MPDSPNSADTPTNPSTDPPTPKGSRLISRVLPPAVRLWLQTQTERIDDLAFTLTGSDRQILSGYVPQVAVAAQQAVYQGLHLSQIDLTATDIRINLGQVVRGKPLRLLCPFPVAGQVVLTQADLTASLASPLLGQALQDLIPQLLANQTLPPPLATALEQAVPTALGLAENQLVLTLSAETDGPPRLTLTTSLLVRDGRVLCLSHPQLDLVGEEPRPAVPLANLELDLGPEVAVETLQVDAEGVRFQGTVRVIPA